MKKRVTLLILSILVSSLFVTGCWNYREIDKLTIVAGVAIDKGTNAPYKLTIEVVQMGKGKNTENRPKIITVEGKTIFDAVRNAISLEGKKLYWSHTKVIIISKDIASNGIVKIIDFFNRDSETRADFNLLISKGDSAKEIFSGQETTDEIKSFILEEILKNQESLGKALKIDILAFNNALQAEGIDAIVPAVELKPIEGKMVPTIMETAIFEEDKLVGFLNDEETKDLLFIKNEIKKGLLIERVKADDESTPVSLEIMKNKTKVTPVVDDEHNIRLKCRYVSKSR